MFDSQDYLRSAFLSREFDNDGEDKVRYDYVTMYNCCRLLNGRIEVVTVRKF